MASTRPQLFCFGNHGRGRWLFWKVWNVNECMRLLVSCLLATGDWPTSNWLTAAGGECICLCLIDSSWQAGVCWAENDKQDFCTYILCTFKAANKSVVNCVLVVGLRNPTKFKQNYFNQRQKILQRSSKSVKFTLQAWIPGSLALYTHFLFFTFSLIFYFFHLCWYV